MTNNKTVEQSMRKIEKILNENPEPISSLEASYQFEVTDLEQAIYQLHFHEGKATVIKGQADRPANCTFKMSEDVFHKFLSGKIKGAAAFMTGKLKINGDMSKALQLESLLKYYKYE